MIAEFQLITNFQKCIFTFHKVTMHKTEMKITETLDYLRINKNKGIFSNTEFLTIIFHFFISCFILKKRYLQNIFIPFAQEKNNN